MADNYLEKKMEEYRAGKLAAKPRVPRTAPARKPGDLTLNFGHLNVIVFGGPVKLAEAVARQFRAVDATVALCHDSEKECTAIAQQTGCRYYPFNPGVKENRDNVIDDFSTLRGNPDIIIDLRSIDLFPDDDCRDTAMSLLLLSHPALAKVSTVTIRE